MKRILLSAYMLFFVVIANAQLVSLEFEEFYVHDDTEYIDPQLGTLVKENAVVTLAAGEEGFLGPFEVDAFNDPSGNITITCSVQTSVKLSVLYL